MGYKHDYADFGAEIMRGAEMVAYLDRIAETAGKIAHQTAPVETGEFRDSFVVGTTVEDIGGLRAVGFLLSTDPDAIVKEFQHGRTMHDAMSQAVETS